MKFVMDERVKFRLTGIVVILAIAVIFLPSMMKKSNQHFEENFSVSLKLPNKPVPPSVSIPKQSAMLKSVKVVHLDIPHVVDEPYTSVIAKAESLSISPAPVVVKVDSPVKMNTTVAFMPTKSLPVKPALSAKIVAGRSRSITSLKGGYGVQLASFTHQNNAASLVSRLRKLGFTAHYNKFSGKQGQFYQVIVGLVNQKNDAITLQKKIASNMQMNGFIIKTGVS